MKKSKNLLLIGAIALGMTAMVSCEKDNPITETDEPAEPVYPIEENPEYQTIELNVKATIEGEANWKAKDEVRINYFYRYDNYTLQYLRDEKGSYVRDESGYPIPLKAADGVKDSFLVASRYSSTTVSGAIEQVDASGVATIKATLTVPENYSTIDRNGNPYNSIVAVDTTITFATPGISCGSSGSTVQWVNLQRLQDGSRDSINAYRNAAIASTKQAVVRNQTIVVDEPLVFQHKTATVKYNIKDEKGNALKVSSFNVLDDGLKAKGDAGETKGTLRYVNILNNTGYQVASVVPVAPASELYVSVLADSINSSNFVGATGEFSYLAVADGQYYQGTGKVELKAGATVEATATLTKIESAVTANTLPITDTKSDLGRVIAKDGKLYDSKDDAEEAGTTAIAVISYVGANGHGLALSLTDISASYITAPNLTKNHAKDNELAGAAWIVPTRSDFEKILAAFGGEAGAAEAFSTGELARLFEGSGAAALSGNYVLNTADYNAFHAYAFFTTYSIANGTFNPKNASSFGLKVRPVLVF